LKNVQGSFSHDSGDTQVEKQPNLSVVQGKCLICLDSAGIFQCYARVPEDKGGLIDVRLLGLPKLLISNQKHSIRVLLFKMGEGL